MSYTDAGAAQDYGGPLHPAVTVAAGITTSITEPITALAFAYAEEAEEDDATSSDRTNNDANNHSYHFSCIAIVLGEAIRPTLVPSVRASHELRRRSTPAAIWFCHSAGIASPAVIVVAVHLHAASPITLGAVVRITIVAKVLGIVQV